MSCQRVGCFAAHSSIASIGSPTRRSFWVSFFRMNNGGKGGKLGLPPVCHHDFLSAPKNARKFLILNLFNGGRYRD